MLIRFLFSCSQFGSVHVTNCDLGEGSGTYIRPGYENFTGATPSCSGHGGSEAQSSGSGASGAQSQHREPGPQCPSGASGTQSQHRESDSQLPSDGSGPQCSESQCQHGRSMHSRLCESGMKGRPATYSSDLVPNPSSKNTDII